MKNSKEKQQSLLSEGEKLAEWIATVKRIKPNAIIVEYWDEKDQRSWLSTGNA